MGGPAVYGLLAAHVRRAVENFKHDVAFITFNYDIGLEIALLTHGCAVDYAASDALKLKCGPPTWVWVLKLHGSANWLRVSDPHAVVETTLRTFDLVAALRDWAPKHTGADGRAQGAFDCLSRVEELAKSLGVEPLPYLVPPTDAKGDARSAMQRVWAEAKRALGEAEVIIVAGYSLPPTDAFFRQFFALANMSDTLVRKFWVADPDSYAKSRIRSLLGPALENANSLGDSLGFEPTVKCFGDELEKHKECF